MKKAALTAGSNTSYEISEAIIFLLCTIGREKAITDVMIEEKINSSILNLQL